MHALTLATLIRPRWGLILFFRDALGLEEGKLATGQEVRVRVRSRLGFQVGSGRIFGGKIGRPKSKIEKGSLGKKLEGGAPYNSSVGYKSRGARN